MEKEHVYIDYWQVGEKQVINCQTCGFNHIYPFPDREELETFYREEYHQKVKAFPYEKMTGEAVQNKLAEVGKNRRFQEIYEDVARLKQAEGRRMLDVGCGNNLLARFFLDKGWTVYALEPNRAAAEYLRKFNLQVFETSAEKMETCGIKDVTFVNMSFVLEHIYEPYRVLSSLHKIMAPGGLLRVCVPNDFSEGQMAYAEYYQETYRWVYLPDHINYFTFDSLSRLLARTGFREVYRTTNFPLEFLLAAGLNYYADEEARKKVGPLVAGFENSFKKTGRATLLKKYYETLARLGLGRSIFMYAVKEKQVDLDDGRLGAGF